MHRRNFIKAVAAGMALKGIDASAGALDSIFGSSTVDFSSLVAMGTINHLELEYIAGGPVCPVCPKIWINHYLPVAFIEIINSPTDSFFFANDVMDSLYGAIGASGISISDDGMQHTSHARIWDIPEHILAQMLLPFSCKYCDKSYATFTPDQDLSALISLAGDAACAGSSVLTRLQNKLQDQLMSALPLACIPKIWYDTTLDPAWISGCHDLAMSTGLAQSLGHTSDTACSVGSSLASNIAGRLGLDLTGAINPCIGSWGSLYPRSAGTVEPNPVKSAAITAYKALHLAGFHYGFFPYKTGLSGKLKQVFPSRPTSLAMPIGSSIASAAFEVTPASVNDKYGFLYYAPVTCAKFPWAAANYCFPIPPCIGSSAQSIN